MLQTTNSAQFFVEKSMQFVQGSSTKLVIMCEDRNSVNLEQSGYNLMDVLIEPFEDILHCLDGFHPCGLFIHNTPFYQDVSLPPSDLTKFQTSVWMQSVRC